MSPARVFHGQTRVFIYSMRGHISAGCGVAYSRLVFRRVIACRYKPRWYDTFTDGRYDGQRCVRFPAIRLGLFFQYCGRVRPAHTNITKSGASRDTEGTPRCMRCPADVRGGPSTCIIQIPPPPLLRVYGLNFRRSTDSIEQMKKKSETTVGP